MTEIKELIIKSHLVPFLFEQLQGKEAKYENNKVNMVKLSSSSSLAQLFYEIFPQYATKENRVYSSCFLLWLHVHQDIRFKYYGSVYIEKKGVKEIVKTTKKNIDKVNNILEDIFRTALIFYIDGQVEAKVEVKSACANFIKKYYLEDCGMELENIRILYYRYKQRKKLSRFQKQASKHTINL